MEDGGGKGWRGKLFHSIGVLHPYNPSTRVWHLLLCKEVQTPEESKEWLFNISCLGLLLPVRVQGQPGPSQRLEESRRA